MNGVEVLTFNNSSIEETYKISTSNIRIGMYQDTDVYKLLGDSGVVTLQNSRGDTYSDSSTGSWDVIAAKQTDSGFDVLLDGANGREGSNYIWSTKSNGVISGGSGWLTDAQTAANGYENTFTKDVNSDGLISGGSFYQLIGDSGVVTLQNSRGDTYSDSSTGTWDVIAAKQTDSGFDVLLDGVNGREGSNYIWSTKSNGVISGGSGWLTDAQTAANGYENTFNMDFNSDGLIL